MTTHLLKHPIKLTESSSISQLNFKDHATARDYLAFDIPGQNAQMIALIASLTNTDVSIIERLHGDDYKACDVIATKLAWPELYNEDGTLKTADEAKDAVTKKDSAS